MKTQKKTLAVVLGGAFAVSLAMAPVVHAEQNPFAMKTLSNGYMVADADQAKDGEKMGEKMKDGKCGTGKCSAAKKKAMHDKEMAEKGKEGGCSAEKKDKEGGCSADKKH